MHLREVTKPSGGESARGWKRPSLSSRGIREQWLPPSGQSQECRAQDKRARKAASWVNSDKIYLLMSTYCMLGYFYKPSHLILTITLWGPIFLQKRTLRHQEVCQAGKVTQLFCSTTRAKHRTSPKAQALFARWGRREEKNENNTYWASSVC